MYVSCLSCPSATFALQCDGVVPREWLATEPVDLDECELIRINQEVEKIEVLVNQFCGLQGRSSQDIRRAFRKLKKD